MISYRYHLVSLIAVFLGIALGVVIGTSALNGAVVGDLRSQVSDLKKNDSALAAQNQVLRARSANADVLAQTYGAKIASGSLAKTPVVLLGAPGAPKGMLDTVADQVEAAGGSVASRLQLSKDFSDPRRANDIRSLATSGLHPIGLQLPTTDDAGALAGALLGYVLLGHGQSTDLAQVIAGFGTLNMVKNAGKTPAAGKLLLLVAPGALPKDSDAGRMLLTFTTQLGAPTGGPTVVVGDPAADTAGGLVALVRQDETASKAVSSVDDANSPLGALTVVLTGAETLAGRKGHYGVGADNDGLLPGAGS
ncbi:copper transporter [Jatrophihabitans sp.]|uniref:copper transporter n=1 Tax=Jatrophihabitans sp. TaxID=1932789 RepID=UPI002CB94DC9|nr:copper transporter [Jatrophihabitans sp.]